MDLNSYVKERLAKDGIAEEEFWNGYDDFKIEVFSKKLKKIPRKGLDVSSEVHYKK